MLECLKKYEQKDNPTQISSSKRQKTATIEKVMSKEDENEWKLTGHPWIERRGIRLFGKKTANAQCIKWLPAGKDSDEDPAL